MRCLALADGIAACTGVAPPVHRWPTALQHDDDGRRRRGNRDVDDLLDAPQVNCARGVCVIDETEPEVCEFDENMEEIVCVPAETPLWPKALLLGSSVLYGTNFALGRL